MEWQWCFDVRIGNQYPQAWKKCSVSSTNDIGVSVRQGCLEHEALQRRINLKSEVEDPFQLTFHLNVYWVEMWKQACSQLKSSDCYQWVNEPHSGNPNYIFRVLNYISPMCGRLSEVVWTASTFRGCRVPFFISLLIISCLYVFAGDGLHFVCLWGHTYLDLFYGVFIFPLSNL